MLSISIETSNLSESKTLRNITMNYIILSHRKISIIEYTDCVWFSVSWLDSNISELNIWLLINQL